LERGRKSLKVDVKAASTRKAKALRVVALPLRFFPGYAIELAQALSCGTVWEDAEKPGVPNHELPIELPCAYQEDHVAFETVLPVKEKDLRALQKAVLAVAGKANKAGMKRGRSLLMSLADGHLTADQFNDRCVREDEEEYYQ
jgi:hypothetical protein